MGMYTAFRVKVTIEPEFREMLATLHSDPYNWETTAAKHPGLISPLWLLVGRRNYIPFGGGGFMPDGWGKPYKSDTDPVYDDDNDSYSEFDSKTGVWEFCCTLKNYEDEIIAFCKLILRNIKQETPEYCEIWYEDDEIKIKIYEESYA